MAPEAYGAARPVILILAEPSDGPALWLRARLAEAVPDPVRIVTPVQLLCSRSIWHRMDGGGVDFRVELADGGIIDGGEVTGVVNRVMTMPTAQLARASEADRKYAEEEVFAFLLGLLGSLECAVVNPASPDCLAGPCPGPILLRQFAADAGLDCEPVSLGSRAPEPPPDRYVPGDQIHFVLDGQLIGPTVPAQARDRLLAFARLWGTRLLQIQSGGAGSARCLRGATALADYRVGGRSLVRALAGVLTR